jgi:hypothetical protein
MSIQTRNFDLDAFTTNTRYPAIGIWGCDDAFHLILDMLKRLTIDKQERVVVACKSHETAKRYRELGKKYEIYVISRISELDVIWQSYCGPLVLAWQENVTKNRKDRLTVQEVEEKINSSLLLILEDNFVESVGSACLSEILTERKRYHVKVIYTSSKTKVLREYTARTKTNLLIVTPNVPVRSLDALKLWTEGVEIPNTSNQQSTGCTYTTIHQGAISQYTL